MKTEPTNSEIASSQAHGAPFWKLLSHDWVSLTTLLLLVIAVVFQGLAILGVFLSRVHYGSHFDPVVFGAFEEVKSGAAVENTFKLTEAKAARLAAERTARDSGSQSLEQAQMELTQAHVRQNESEFVTKESEKRAEGLLHDAEISWRNKNFNHAISQLQSAIQFAPEFLPAIKKSALYLEERRDYAQARFQWEKAAGIAQPQSAEMEEIQQNLTRVTKLYSQIKLSQEGVHPTAFVTPPLPAKPNSITLGKIARNELAAEDLYDLRFNLRIPLLAKGSEPFMDVSQAKVEVIFYDQFTLKDGSILPQKILTSSLQPKQAWPTGSEEVLVLNYSVPRGYFRKKVKTFGNTYIFSGYVVRVYYKGQLQETLATPSHLPAK